MRYYDIQITDPGSGKSVLHYTSHPRGTGSPPDPGALQVEVDIMQLPYGQAAANSSVRIWGIPLDIVSSGSNYNLKNCTVKGGMGRGLPLANPRQAGTLAAGQIIQAYGNWVGTDMTLDLILQPGYAQEQKGQEPRNLTVNWPENQPMKDMLDQTLKIGFPGLNRQIDIRDNLKLPNAEIGFYGMAAQFSQYVKNLSRKIAGAQDYTGVDIFVQGNTVYAQDGTKEGNVVSIQPQDLIGQPTWIAPQTVQAALVMRGDLRVGSYVKLPDGLITTRSSSLSTFSTLKSKTAFQGKFWVQKLRHVGNFRQADGRAWTTIADCLVLQNNDYNPTDLGPGYGVQTGPGYT